MKSINVFVFALALAVATTAYGEDRPPAGVRYQKEKTDVPLYRAPGYSETDLGLEVEHLRKRIDALEIRNAQTEQRLADVITSYNDLVTALNSRQHKFQAQQAAAPQSAPGTTPSGIPLPRQ